MSAGVGVRERLKVVRSLCIAGGAGCARAAHLAGPPRRPRPTPRGGRCPRAATADRSAPANGVRAVTMPRPPLE
ncbi:unnamed protein product, partial [Iphiclides podalirius]